MTAPITPTEELREQLHSLFYEQSLKYPVDSSEVRWNYQEALKLFEQFSTRRVIEELKQAWNATQPDIVPQGTRMTDEAVYIKARIHALEASLIDGEKKTDE